MKIAIISINQPSLNSACRLIPYLKDFDVDIYGKKELNHTLSTIYIYDKLDDILALAWQKYDAIICILAMGAVVRKIAPFLRDKSTDPAILVINLALDRVVPLLSGHLGGANELATTISDRLPNCINFITTATDQTKTLAFEMLAKQNGWGVENLKALANISNRLINKKIVKVITYKNIFDSLPDKDSLDFENFSEVESLLPPICGTKVTTSEDIVVISPNIKSKNLTLKPKVFLGIGMNRGVSCEEIEEAVEWFLEKHNLEFNQIENIASFEAKRDEVGLIEFAKKYSFDIEFFGKKDINSLQNSFSTSQATKFFGIKGVAEPSALLISKYRELIITKEVFDKKITISGAI